MASKGYPEDYEKGVELRGLNEASEHAEVFFSGVKEVDGTLVTSGGRVLNVVGRGATLKESIEKAYAGVSKIDFDNAYFRKDIGVKGLRYFSA